MDIELQKFHPSPNLLRHNLTMYMEWWAWSQIETHKPNRLCFYFFRETNIAAATDLLDEKNFYYFFYGINIDNTVENSLVRQRRLCGGNFFIDSKDILAAAKVVNLHSLLKCRLFPRSKVEPDCPMCQELLDDEEIDFTLGGTELTLD